MRYLKNESVANGWLSTFMAVGKQLTYRATHMDAYILVLVASCMGYGR